MLEIIGWLELSVLHMVFFHPHKSSIRICFGITVPVTTEVNLLCVFLQFFHVFFQCFNGFLDLAFSFSDSMDKHDPFFLFDLIESFPDLFQGSKTELLSIKNKTDPIEYLAFLHKDCDLLAKPLLMFCHCFLP